MGFLLPQQAAGQADMAITPASSTVSTGDTFTLTVGITANGASFTAADAYLSFDPALLQVQSINAGGSELPLPLLSVFDNGIGTIDYSAGTLSAAVTADIDLLLIEFQAVSDGVATISYYDPDGPSSPIQSGVFLTGSNVVNSLSGATVTIEPSNLNPVASFTITPNPAETNQVVSFDGTGSTDDGTIVLWEWDFDGDGTFDDTTSGANTSFSYTTATSYTVTLRVTDDGGLQGISQQPVTITSPSITTYTVTASAGPNGTISPTGAVSVDEGDNVTFTITPDSGFEIAELLVDGNPVAPTLSYEFIGVTQNSSISVTFQEIPPFQLCIASGSADLVAFGRNFIGDPATAPPTGLGFTRTNGTVYAGYSGPIAGTTGSSGEELLFQKEIYGGAPANPAYIYDIPVANGFYQVDLYFAEVFHPAAGGRVFDVLLDGNLILDEYDLVDPVKDGLSSNQTAITRTYYVQVTDGSVSLQIGDATIDNGKLSGICVTEVPSANLHPLSAIGDFSVNAGEAAAVLLNINDPESDLLSVTLNGLPASLSYNAGTGQVEGTPLPGDAGIYTINAIVSDGTSAPVTEEFTLTINPPAGDDPPAIAAIAEVFANEGDAISVPITVTDDTNPAASIEIFDVSAGGTNPFTPTTTVTVGSLTDNGGGSYTFDWTPAPGEGKSYLAVVTANDGVNLPVTEAFRINVAQQVPGTIQARTFFNPDPWYGSTAPTVPYTVAIETSAAQNIGYIDNGDLVDFYVNIPSAGTYDLEVFAAKGITGVTTVTFSEESGGGFASLGTVGVVNNGAGWQDYASYTTQLTFTNPGPQTLRMSFNGGANVSHFILTAGPDAAPTIDAVADAELSEGGTLNLVVQVNDDSNPSATIEIFDKSAFTSPNTDPFTSGATVPAANYTFTESPAGSGTYTLNWPTGAGDGRSYLARVTANDGVNPAVTTDFNIDVAQPIPATVLARTFANPLPWYGGSPAAPFTVAIENTAAQNIGWIGPGEFVEYLIDVPTAGTYTVEMFAGNGSGAATTVTYLEESGGGFTPVGSVVAPVTAWQSYSGYATDITLTNPGPQTLRLGFNGGVNIRDFVITQTSTNATPVVSISTPADGIYATSDVTLSFAGTAIDTEDGDLSASISWSSDLDGPLGVGASVSTSLTVGTHIITASATDLDGAEPQTGTAAITVNVVVEAPFCATPSFRVNAGGPAILSSNGNFEEDQKGSGPTNGTAQLGTPSPYLDLTAPALDQTFGSTAPLVSNTTGYPDYLFQTERYSEAANPDNMNWAFPTGNGVFDVKILFNENWTGEASSPRVFDVEIEGELALDDYRPSVDGTQINVAKVETYQVTVVDGVLNINFLKGTQNPAVKGFDICFVSDLNTEPIVSITNPLEGATVTRGQAITLQATANDTQDGDVSASIQWTSDTDTQFSPSGTGGNTTGTFVTPGTQTLRATASDSEPLEGFDEISVEVSAPAVSFVSPTGGSTLSGLTVGVEVNATDVLFGNTEHFHFYINPPDPNNLDINTRVSTAPASAPWKLSDTEFVFDEISGALSANGLGNGVVEGENTIVVIVADQFHNEFANPEARAEVSFDVCLVSITEVVVTDPSDCGTSDGSIVITATGSNLEYSIDNGVTFQASNSFSGLSEGNYNVVVQKTDDTGCTDADTATLTAPTAPAISLVTPTDPTDCSVNDGSIVITATGTDLEYSIDNGNTFQASNTFTALPAGTYNIVVREVGTLACLATDSATLTAPTAPAITNVAPTDPTDCGVDDGSIVITATGSNLEYSIDNGASFQVSNSFTGLAAGNYDIVVREVGTANCLANDSATLTAPSAPVITDASGEDPSGCTTDNGSIGITATGTLLEYSIDGGATFFQNGGDFTGLADGTYDIVVREVNSPSCSATDQVVLSDPIGPMPVISGPLNYPEGTPGVTLDAGAGYTSYLWSTGETTQTIDVLAGTYSVTVTDANGCEGSSVSFIVSEDEDNTNPTAVCKDIEIFLDVNGLATLSAADIDGGSTDDVGIASLTASTTSFNCSNLGGNLVMLTVTDINGNSDFCMATVTVTDPVAPIVSCAANVIVTSSNGNPVIVTVPEPGILDNCDSGLTATAVRSDNASLTLSDPFPVGTTQIYWSATDASGNMGTCFQNVIVNFTPSIENDIVSFGVSGQVGTSAINTTAHTVQFTMPFGTDLSSLAPSIGVSPFASVNPDTGVANDFTTPAQYIVTAQNGSQQTWEVSASLEADGENPVVNCPADIIINNDDDQCGAVATFSATATDNDGSTPSIGYSHASGSVFPVGTTTVTVTATDLAGNSAQCTFDVTVNDAQAPEIFCPADQTLTGNASGNLSLPDLTSLVSALDNCDPSVVVTQSPVAGTTVSGTTTVTMTAVDAAGNSASCSFDVIVQTPSVANLVIVPSSMEVTLFAGQNADVFYTVDSDDASILPTPAAMMLTDNATGNPPIWAATTSAANQDTPYEVSFNTVGLAPGTYTGVLEAGPVTGYNNASIPITLNVEAIPALGVLEFVLVDADSDTDLFPISNGMLIDVTTLPTANLNIRAVATTDAESVVFQLTGTLNKNQTESVPPYALYGDSSGNYVAQVFPLGAYSLAATAYAGNGGGGAAGPTATVNFTFTDENPACAAFDASLSSSSNPSTCSGTDGSATIAVSGATGAVSYLWSHDAGFAGAAATGLSAGSYTVTVTDANGCIDVVNFTLSEPATPVVSLAPFASVLDTDAPFALSGGSPAGGSYSGPGVSGGFFDPSVGPGTFPISYTYSDGNGCSNSAVQNILVTSELGSSALIVLDANTDTELFALVDGMTIYKSDIGETPLGIIYNASLNPGGVQFNLSGPITQNRFEGPAPHSLFGDVGVNIQGVPFPVGNYILIADPNNGPTLTVNFTVADEDPVCIGFDASLTASSNPSGCDVADGSASVGVTGATGTVTYVWSHDAGLNSPVASGLAAGSYSVTATDENGCADTVNFSLNGPALPVVTLAPQPSVLVSDAAFALSGGAPAGGMYSGPGVSAGVFDPSVGPGTFQITYTYTDGNGCTNSATQNLVVSSDTGDAALILLNADTDVPLFELTDGLVIDLSVTGNVRLGVIYNADLNPGGVQFDLSGPLTQSRFEGPAPHSLFGDVGTNIRGRFFPLGNYTLVADPVNGPTQIVNFSVVQGFTGAKIAPPVPMKASPNPADTEVNITFEEPVRLVTLHVFDTSGKLVKVVQAEGDATLNSYPLQVMDLPIGIYYIRATDVEGKTYQEEIVVSRYR